MASPTSDVTQLLREWCSGDDSVLDELTPLVYRELRRLADSYMRRERPGHTLQPTALIHEERKAQIIELKFFGGMTDDEVAEALEISVRTLGRDLRLAKAWLGQILTSQPNGRTARGYGAKLLERLARSTTRPARMCPTCWCTAQRTRTVPYEHSQMRGRSITQHGRGSQVISAEEADMGWQHRT
jgi:predicted DNA-binding protein (UPF0251 family)